MDTRTIARDKFDVQTIEGYGLDTLIELCAPQYEASLEGMLYLMQRVAEHGTSSLTAKQFHYIDKKNGIFQFRKGDFRLLGFNDSGRIIVCVHGILKKSMKTPKKDIKTAIRRKKSYLEASND